MANRNLYIIICTERWYYEFLDGHIFVHSYFQFFFSRKYFILGGNFGLMKMGQLVQMCVCVCGGGE